MSDQKSPGKLRTGSLVPHSVFSNKLFAHHNPPRRGYRFGRWLRLWLTYALERAIKRYYHQIWATGQSFREEPTTIAKVHTAPFYYYLPAVKGVVHTAPFSL